MKIEASKIILGTETIREYGGYFYFTDIYSNTFWKISVSTSDGANLVCKINEENGKKRCFSDFVIDDGYAYLIPMSADGVYRVELVSGSYIKLLDMDKLAINCSRYHENVKYMAAVIYEDKLYLFPATASSILKINLRDNTVKYIVAWEEESVFNRSENCLFRRVIRRDSYIYAPFCGTNKVLILNIDNDETKIIQIGDCKDKGFSSALIRGKYVYLSPREKGCIVIYNMDLHCVESLIDCPVQDSRLVEWGNEIVLVSETDDPLYIIKENNHLEVVDNLKEIKTALCAEVSKDGKMWFVEQYSGKSYRISRLGDEVEEFTLQPSRYWEKLLISETIKTQVCTERQIGGLNEFLSMLKRG